MDNKSPDAFRTISEVADWLGVPTHVLRFWESRFTQVKPVKRAGGRRYYRPSDMELLGGIRKLLHDDGLTIRGVQKLLREQGVKHVAAMSQPLDLEAEPESNVVPLDRSRRSTQEADPVEDAEILEAPEEAPEVQDVDASEAEDAMPEPVDDAMANHDVALDAPGPDEELEDVTPVSFETVDEKDVAEPVGEAVAPDADASPDDAADFNPFASAPNVTLEPTESDIPEEATEDSPLAVEEDAGIASLVAETTGEGTQVPDELAAEEDTRDSESAASEDEDPSPALTVSAHDDSALTPPEPESDEDAPTALDVDATHLSRGDAERIAPAERVTDADQETENVFTVAEADVSQNPEREADPFEPEVAPAPEPERPRLVLPDVGPDLTDEALVEIRPVARRLRELRDAGGTLPVAMLRDIAARLQALKSNAGGTDGPADRL